MTIKPIKTEADYRQALAEVERLFEAELNTPEGDCLEILTTLIEVYEEKHHPINSPLPYLNIDEIQHLSRFIKLIQESEGLILTRGDRAIAEIKPISTPQKQPRPIGLCEGEFTVPDDFNEPLPEEILNLFEHP